MPRHFTFDELHKPFRLSDMRTEGKGINESTERANTIVGMPPNDGRLGKESNLVNPSSINPKIGGKILDMKPHSLVEKMRQIAPRIGEKKEKKKKVILEF